MTLINDAVYQSRCAASFGCWLIHRTPQARTRADCSDLSQDLSPAIALRYVF